MPEGVIRALLRQPWHVLRPARRNTATACRADRAVGFSCAERQTTNRPDFRLEKGASMPIEIRPFARPAGRFRDVSPIPIAGTSAEPGARFRPVRFFYNPIKKARHSHVGKATENKMHTKRLAITEVHLVVSEAKLAMSDRHRYEKQNVVRCPVREPHAHFRDCPCTNQFRNVSRFR